MYSPPSFGNVSSFMDEKPVSGGNWNSVSVGHSAESKVGGARKRPVSLPCFHLMITVATYPASGDRFVSVSHSLLERGIYQILLGQVA